MSGMFGVPPLDPPGLQIYVFTTVSISIKEHRSDLGF